MSITELLREMITRGELPPGKLLRQRDLAKLFNVSPTPVREALRRLESEGLVGSELHRGSHVAEIDVDEQEENYLILAELEALATKLAVEKMTPRDLHEVQACEQAFAQVAEDRSVEPTADLNREFHFRIYECRAVAAAAVADAAAVELIRARPPAMAPARSRSRITDAWSMRWRPRGGRAARITREHVLGSIGLMRKKLRGG